MFVDSRILKNGISITSDVCIVGAGPAGISLAMEFLNKSFKVCLLESGDVGYDEETAELSEGESCGDPFSPLSDMRRRPIFRFNHLVTNYNGNLSRSTVVLFYSQKHNTVV
jgi:choline dehydrogenase-like flavoprotein